MSTMRDRARIRREMGDPMLTRPRHAPRAFTVEEVRSWPLTTTKPRPVVWPPKVQLALPAPPGISGACAAPNLHHECLPEYCTCTCHTLDPAKRGWLLEEMETRLAAFDPYIGPYEPGIFNGKQEEWWYAATVFAVWDCGTDHVRIQHALKHQPTIVFKAAQNLRANHIWGPEGTWFAPYAEEDCPDEDLLAITLHVLAAKGRVQARLDRDGGFLYSATPR